METDGWRDEPHDNDKTGDGYEVGNVEEEDGNAAG